MDLLGISGNSKAATHPVNPHSYAIPVAEDPPDHMIRDSIGSKKQDPRSKKRDPHPPNQKWDSTRTGKQVVLQLQNYIYLKFAFVFAFGYD